MKGRMDRNTLRREDWDFRRFGHYAEPERMFPLSWKTKAVQTREASKLPSK
jgi:hypothetical protein